MPEMKPRERVLVAIEHQEPDRVPTALWGGPYGIVDELYFKLLNLFELGEPLAPFRQGHNISYMDDRILERLGIDTRYVWPGVSPSSPVHQSEKEGKLLDSYGQPWIRALPYFYPDRGILVEAKDADDINRLVDWPDLADPRWTSGVTERAKTLKEKSDYFVIGRMVTSHGPFQTASDLRGIEQFLMDLATDESFALTLIDRVTDTIDGLLRGYLHAGGEYFDMVELPGDDYASRTNLMISKPMFRKFFKPALRRLVETIKSYRIDLKVMFHSDGMIMPLLSELIDIGVDVVHPLEPVPSMNLEEAKAQYGDRLCFLGGIDISRVMPGTRQDVIEEAKLRIRQLASGGGYILAPSNHLQADVPPENVVALYEAAHQYGEYSLAKP